MKVRIKFRKYGPVRFIGHLDVMRYFQKALRRAEIDIAYTSGFSPHQIMSFASPLGVGLESNGEYMDIECHSVTTSADMIKRINATAAFGIEVTAVKALPEHAGNAMASVAAASYTVRFREGRAPKASLADFIPGFLSKEEILITKETKTGIKQVDIKPGIYSLYAEEDQNTGTKLFLMVDASSAGNIKPGKVVEELLKTAGEELQENALLITREETFTALETNGVPKFIPLMDVGDDII